MLRALSLSWSRMEDRKDAWSAPHGTSGGARASRRLVAPRTAASRAGLGDGDAPPPANGRRFAPAPHLPRKPLDIDVVAAQGGGQLKN